VCWLLFLSADPVPSWPPWYNSWHLTLLTNAYQNYWICRSKLIIVFCNISVLSCNEAFEFSSWASGANCKSLGARAHWTRKLVARHSQVRDEMIGNFLLMWLVIVGGVLNINMHEFIIL
jgi:hypothetical protein